ncbi:MAG TPA: helix-turn-helix domain-containing protein [Candidatus Saccharimonadales bacterium]|nr:helix-turn-helix domain-containing protein [Candidatus Saccharimonadales bacterium]
MKRLDRKSDCAINYTLEAIGDPWSLLIVRDIVYFGKKTYGEFLASEEAIAEAPLARRLAALQAHGILTKKRSQTDKRKEEYSLTQKGIDLIPLIIDFAIWGAKHDTHTGADQEWINKSSTKREEALQDLQLAVKDGRAFFKNQ